jgi:hypothetical protein
VTSVALPPPYLGCRTRWRTPKELIGQARGIIMNRFDLGAVVAEQVSNMVAEPAQPAATRSM